MALTEVKIQQEIISGKSREREKLFDGERKKALKKNKGAMLKLPRASCPLFKERIHQQRRTSGNANTWAGAMTGSDDDQEQGKRKKKIAQKQRGKTGRATSLL